MVLNTVDGGRNWSQQVVSADSQLHAASFWDPHIGWSVGSNIIVFTSNGGETWQTQYTSKDVHRLLGVACLDSTRAVVVGENGTLLHTEDAGKTWSRTDVNTNKSLVRIRFYGDDGWILGIEGTLIRTLNGGTNWELQSLGVREGLSDIYFVGREGWLVGMGGTILRTSDGGHSWIREASPTEYDLFSLFFLNRNHGWIGGSRRIRTCQLSILFDLVPKLR